MPNQRSSKLRNSSLTPSERLAEKIRRDSAMPPPPSSGQFGAGGGAGGGGGRSGGGGGGRAAGRNSSTAAAAASALRRNVAAGLSRDEAYAKERAKLGGTGPAPPVPVPPSSTSASLLLAVPGAGAGPEVHKAESPDGRRAGTGTVVPSPAKADMAWDDGYASSLKRSAGPQPPPPPPVAEVSMNADRSAGVQRISLPGAVAVPGPGAVTSPRSAGRDPRLVGAGGVGVGVGGGIGGDDGATQHAVVATLVPDDPTLVAATARKDSLCELVRHDRRTRIVAGLVLVALVGLGVGLGLALGRSAPPPTPADLKYVPVGSSVDGPRDGEYGRFGEAVSTSRDGRRIAVGAPLYGDDRLGLVQILEERDGEWQRLGTDLVGDGPGDGAGSSVALSLDGRTVAVGSPGYGSGAAASASSARNDAGAGQVKVYAQTTDDGTSWTPLGRPIVGRSAGEEVGSSVSISEDGRRVAVSVPGTTSFDRADAETARVYEYDDAVADWVQLGDDLVGRYGGSPLSMSADGSTVVMGSVSTAKNDDVAAVRVYEYATDAEEWRLMGSDIILKGAAGSYDTGWRPSISSDGRTIAVGSAVLQNEDDGGDEEEYDLLVRVFHFVEGDYQYDWVQLGETLHDKRGSHLISYVASLSADGNVLAIGDPGGFAMGINSGHAHVLRLVDGEWVHVDKELEGNDPADIFGHAVSVSADGSRVAIGAPKSRSSGSERGRVTVFELQELYE